MAQASASAASVAGWAESRSSRFTISCTCSLLARPWPTTACFTCSAVYSATGNRAVTAAQIAARRRNLMYFGGGAAALGAAYVALLGVEMVSRGLAA